ncbi:MAG: EamA family transporter RarD [Proteobacteria bacterium]|nr:EamA family transporter RarD [Pseudomonadota bacterium]
MQKIGVIYAAAAFFTWGFLPIYWKVLGFLTPLEVLFHRMIWSLVFALLLLQLQGRIPEVIKALKDRRTVLLLTICAIIISTNWFIYIWAIGENRIVETSLGYYINPLINVLLGVIFFHEKLNRLEQISVLLATVGVGYFVVNFGSIPWISLLLAFSFGFYGLIRKKLIVKPMVGMAIETAILSPFALWYLLNYSSPSISNFTLTWWQGTLIVGTGLATLLPLFWFAHAAQKIQLSTIGFMQYIAPTLQLLVGVFLYKEPFTPTHLITFGFIWSALLLYTFQTIWKNSGKYSREN